MKTKNFTIKKLLELQEHIKKFIIEPLEIKTKEQEKLMNSYERKTFPLSDKIWKVGDKFYFFKFPTKGDIKKSAYSLNPGYLRRKDGKA